MEPAEPAPPPPPTEKEAVTALLAQLRERVRRPYATWTIIALNVAVWGIMIASGVDVLKPTPEVMLRWGGTFTQTVVREGDWWRLFTATFLHYGILHIAMNMLVLADIGRFVERLLGTASFVVAYVIAGLAGSMASIYFNTNAVGAGASGAVFGLFGVLVAYLLRHRHTIPPLVLSRLARTAGVFIAYNLIGSLQIKNVDVAGHIGGLVGGFAIGLLLAGPGLAASHARRALAVLAAAVVLVPLALVAPAGGQPELEAALKGSDEAMQRFGELGTAWEGGTLEDDAFAVKLETELLPQLRRPVDVLAAGHRDESPPERLQKLLRVLQLRVDGVAEIAAAARAHDRSKVKPGVDKLVEAAKLLEELNQTK